MTKFDREKLAEFLVKAKRATYAAGVVAEKVVEPDQSTSLRFVEGDFCYHDNYFGGEPFGGREVVFFDNQPVFMMVYYGRVDEVIDDFGPIYQVLMGALKKIPVSHPFRGPNSFETDDYLYENKYDGELENFSGEEKISYDGRVVYRAKYAGGLICQK